jgi:glycosyltransferase involved in cell wall biosynthesis
MLDRGMLGGDVPADIYPLVERVRAAATDGVFVHRPRADPDMADVYRAARVHLYPGAASEVYCSTLAESQAVGLPGVSRRLPAAGERIRDSESGFVVPDDEAFGNCAMLFLYYDQIFKGRSDEARNLQRGRDWDAAAAEFAALFS